jgi:hypothetical protein
MARPAHRHPVLGLAALLLGLEVVEGDEVLGDVPAAEVAAVAVGGRGVEHRTNSTQDDACGSYLSTNAPLVLASELARRSGVVDLAWASKLAG